MGSNDHWQFIQKTLPFLEKSARKGGYADYNYHFEDVDGFGHKLPDGKVTQNVATGEIARGYLNLYLANGSEKWLKRASESGYWLLSRQNDDGSWNEELPYYNYPSVVASSIAGDALLGLYKIRPDKELLRASKKCRDFVLRNEVGFGVFRKSTFMLMNTLNVNAHAGAFLAEYSKVAKDKSAADAARRAVFAIAKHQYPDGAIPYTNGERCYSSALQYDVKPLHYQAVSLFYLLKIRSIVHDILLDNLIEKGRAYLRKAICPDGRLKWSMSAFPYEYFQNAAYGFTMATLDDKKDEPKICGLEAQLEKERLADGGFARYQHLGAEYCFGSFAPHLLNTFYAGDYRFKDRLFRVKELLCKIAATRDRRSQLFTTAKIFECATHLLSENNEKKEHK